MVAGPPPEAVEAAEDGRGAIMEAAEDGRGAVMEAAGDDDRCEGAATTCQ